MSTLDYFFHVSISLILTWLKKLIIIVSESNSQVTYEIKGSTCLNEQQPFVRLNLYKLLACILLLETKERFALLNLNVLTSFSFSHICYIYCKLFSYIAPNIGNVFYVGDLESIL